MRKLPIIMGSVCVALAATLPARAVVISVGALKDNTLYEESSGSLSNGVGDYFFAGVTESFLIRRGVMAFDIAGAVPSGATINSATLKLHMSRCGPTCLTTVSMELHRLQADWGEAGSDAFGQEGGGDVAQPGDATWIHTFYNTDFWTNSGGDYDAAVSGSQNVTSVGSYLWSSAQLVADTQNWLDNPGGNYGWILLGGEDTAGTAKRFDSKDNFLASVQPKLTIDYTPVPEPSTIFFVGAGMVAVLRFRRR